MNTTQAACGLIAVGVKPEDAPYIASKMSVSETALITTAISADFEIRKLARRVTGKPFDERFCVVEDNALRYSRECDVINTICTAMETEIEYDDDF